MAKTLRLDIVTPERVVYSNDNVSMVVARAIDGELGILPNHAPLITALEIAPLRIKYDDETETQISLGGGFMDVQDNQVVILANVAEIADEIDLKRAEAAKERAEERLQNVNEFTDVQRAELALRRALVRIKVAGQVKIRQ